MIQNNNFDATNASKQNAELFKFQLEQQARKTRDNQLKLKPAPNQLTPISLEKTLGNAVKKVLNEFIQTTIHEIKPLLAEWDRQNKVLVGDGSTYNLGLKFIKDEPSDDLDQIDEKWEQLRKEMFEGNNKGNIKAQLAVIALSVSSFNQKQWQKVLKGSTGTEFIIQEAWEEPVIKAWVNRNVNLIKGLTDEYTKKIKEAVYSAWENNVSAEELAKTLTKINQNFATGGFKEIKIKKIINGKEVIMKRKIRKQSRAQLIGRDQINKLNGVYSRRRQHDAGVDWYRWHTAADERVRKTHKPLEGKICKWSDSTVYADSIADAKAGNWKSRSSIGAVSLHPGEDIQCRCFAEPILDDMVDEVNQELKEEKPVTTPTVKSKVKAKPTVKPKPISRPKTKPVSKPKPEIKKKEINIDSQNNPKDVIRQKKFTDSEGDILQGYKENDFKHINHYLREGKLLDNKWASEKTMNGMVKKIDNSLVKSTLKKDVSVYKGIRVNNIDDYTKNLKNKTIVLDGYQSTTTKKGVGELFAGSDKNNSGILKLNAKKDMHAINMDQFASGSNKNEFELLFKHNTEFKITDIYKDKNNRTIIEGDIL